MTAKSTPAGIRYVSDVDNGNRVAYTNVNFATGRTSVKVPLPGRAELAPAGADQTTVLAQHTGGATQGAAG